MYQRLKPTPSMIVASVALIVAIGGSATAASGLIGGSQIKNGTITKAKLTPSLRRQIGVHALPGIPGPAGPSGPAGGFDPAKVTYVLGPTTVMNPGDVVTVQAICPAGTKAIGGGYLAVAGLVSTVAIPDGSGWQAIVGNDTGVVTDTNEAFAVCAAR